METQVSDVVTTKTEISPLKIQKFGTGTGTAIFAELCPVSSTAASSFLSEIGSPVYTVQMRGF